jgi:hypothetical protein
MQSLFLILALAFQSPQATEQNPAPQPPAPTKTPPVPGKVLPLAVPPKSTPQAPPVGIPGPQTQLQAPAKLLPQEQRPPATQAAVPSKEVLGPDQQVYINQYGCYCVGQQVLQGPPERQGKWVVKYKVTTPQGTATYKASGYGAQSYAQYGGGDSYGFVSWLNGVRAQHGLPAVGYDPNLSAWAQSNNAQQNSRGMGHYVMGPARRQNSAMGSYSSVPGMWMASGAHRAALLDPSIRNVGIAGSGAYWTFNAN